MDENLQNIEDLFKNALENDEEQLPPKVWNNIDHILDKDNLVSIKRKYNSLKKLATLLLLLLICFSIYELSKEFRTDLKKENNLIAKDEISKNTNDKKLVEKKYSNTKRQLGPVEEINAINENLTTKNNFNDFANQAKSNSKNSSDIKRSQILPDYNDNYKMSLKNYEAVKAEPQINNNNDRQMNIELQYLKPGEKISMVAMDSIKSLSLSPFNKIAFIVDEKKIQQKNRKVEDRKVSRFSVTTFFSPDFASYHLEDDEDDNQPDNANTFHKKETHDLSSTSGALMDYKLNNRWSLQSGITFSNTNITLDPTIIYAEIDNTGSIKYRINLSSGYGFILPSFRVNPNVGDSLYVFTSAHNLQYIGIPLAIKYNIEKGKFNFNVFAGTSVNLLVKGKVETLVENGTNNEIEVLNNLHGLKKIYFYGSAGIGMEYKLDKKFALTFSPTMRFALNSINKNASVKSYPNSFGLLSGIKIRL
ncbi:MAG: outer membrane beta-barrel protein [Ginsengibacter sp.]